MLLQMMNMTLNDGTVVGSQSTLPCPKNLTTSSFRFLLLRSVQIICDTFFCFFSDLSCLLNSCFVDYRVCVKDCGLHSQKYWYHNFSCMFNWFYRLAQSFTHVGTNVKIWLEPCKNDVPAHICMHASTVMRATIRSTLCRIRSNYRWHFFDSFLTFPTLWTAVL